MNVKAKNGKVLVCLIMALTLLMSGGVAMFARGVDAPPVAADTYKAKQIARYSLDEVKTVAEVPASGDTPKVDAYNYYEAKNIDGVTIDTLKGVTANNSQKLVKTAMQGANASNFGSSDLVVSKFLPADKKGFTASAWMINHGGDWGGFMSAAGYTVALPNIDPFIPWKNNLFPGDANKVNGGQWDSFMNIDNAAPVTASRLNDYYFFTVSVDDTGINFYKNGIKLITYSSATMLNALEGSTKAHSVGEFATEFLKVAKTGNVSFFTGNIVAADDFRLFNTLTDAEVLGLYNEASSLTVSKISSKVGAKTSILAEYNYDNAIAGVPSEAPIYTSNYVIGDAGKEDEAKPEISFIAAKFADKALVNYTTGVTVTKTTSERVVDTVNKVTKFTETHTLKIGDMTRVIKIDFVRNDEDIEKAKTRLSFIKVNDTLIKGFDMAKLAYNYALAPEIKVIPVVTYEGILPELVTITDNKADAFNGASFAYNIIVKDKTSSAVLNTYTITFTRKTSAVVEKVSLDGNTIHNFNKEQYYNGTTGAQNAYIDELITDPAKVSATLVYGDAAEIKATTIDATTKMISIVITDTVSNIDSTYAFEQKVFSDQTAPLYSFDFSSANLSEEEVVTPPVDPVVPAANEKTGSYISADKKVKTFKSVTVGENSVTLGEDGYIDISGVFGENMNADGVTISTWMRMASASKNQWAGIMALSGNKKNLILNNNQVLTGDFNGAWNNEGTAANSTAFKSDVYKYVSLVITKNYAILYVDGGVKEVEASIFRLNAESILGLGRSHMLNETLGSGEYKNITIFNEPLSASSVMSEYKKSELSLLTSLKFAGSESNVKDFAGVNFNYELNYSSDKTAPVAADFPTLVAVNGSGAVTDIVAGSVEGASLTYTITSSAAGFSNVYTVKVTLVNNNYVPKKIEIKYSGTTTDLDVSIPVTEFKLVDGKMVATYKVWSGCDLSKLLINFIQDVGQSKESENLDKKASTYSVMLYAADASCMEYVIKFVEDASIVSPDFVAAPPSKGGCKSSAMAGAASGVTLLTVALLAVVLAKKKATNK